MRRRVIELALYACARMYVCMCVGEGHACDCVCDAFEIFAWSRAISLYISFDICTHTCICMYVHTQLQDTRVYIIYIYIHTCVVHIYIDLRNIAIVELTLTLVFQETVSTEP